MTKYIPIDDVVTPRYLCLQSSIRAQFYDMIAASGLRRCLSVERIQEYSLQAGQRIFHFANCSSFSRCPELVLMCFVSDARHAGNLGRPRNIFHHFSLQDLSVYINGIPSYLNESTRSMNLKSIDSPHVDLFYRLLIDYWRPHAENSISRVRFHTEMFLYTIETAIVPRFLYPEDPGDTVNLVRSVNLSLECNFAENLQENIQMFLISFDKAIVTIGTEGEISES